MMMMMSNNTTDYTNEREQENRNTHDYEEETNVGSGCGCFKLFCFDTNDRQKWSLLQGGDYKNEEPWLIEKMKEVKEFSEVVAGPKWKNFIRKLGKYSKKTRMAECRQYDPQSYALNFDDGVAAGDDQEDSSSSLLRGFSSKFASPRPLVSSHRPAPVNS